MRKQLVKDKKIVLYGAGQKSHSTYSALRMSGYKIAYCVVSSDCIEETDFEDVKVYSFSQKKNDIIELGYQLVIACAQKSEADIAENIERNGIKEYWKTNEMPWSVDYECYRNLDSQGYMEIIREKYYSNIDEYGGDETVRRFIEGNTHREANRKKIMFLLTNAAPRAYKIIDALHRKGYDVELIIWINAMYLTSEKCKEFLEISNRCRICIDAEEVMLYCAATDARILHIFSDANSDIELPQILIHCKNIFPKIVFDEYDVMTEMRRDIPQRTVDAEIFCLKYADGLCNRYMCMEYLEEKGYELCKQRIYFIDCCNDFTNYESPQKRESDALHLVFAGTLFSDKEYKTSKDGRFLELGVLCEANEVHLHLYPVSYDAAKLHEYIDMERLNPYFHLHHPVSARALAQELSQYDYGVTSVQNDILTYSESEGSWMREGIIYCWANKLYDYLDAGLPIVTTVPVKQTQILERDGVLLRMFDEEINFDELRKRRNELKKRVIQVREKYRVSNQLPALIEFYDSL
ncbi:MAG: hypothetical protein K2N73_06160 [Lachnospiraceae bacterium]|nr:hypothetical protein [Lachnospiraceae bacterium]